MKTKLYEIRKGELLFVSERQDVPGSPDIVVFNYDREMTKQELLKIFDLETAEIKASVTYPVNANGKEPDPEYYTYFVTF